MNKKLRTLVLDKVGTELKNHGFCLADFSNQCLVFHRKSLSYMEIIQIGKDKYETCLIVSASIVYLNVSNKMSNINYPMFNECHDGSIETICVDDCLEKCHLRGHFGNGFHYGDVYLVLGRGIVGISPQGKKPLGIKLKKYKDTTYSELCDLVVKRLSTAYSWLERKKQGTR